MIDQLHGVLGLAPGLVRRVPAALPAAFERAGIKVSRCPGGRRLLVHFMVKDGQAAIRVVDRPLGPQTTALLVLQAGLRIAAGQGSGYLTASVHDEAGLDGWLAVADVMIGDGLADHLLAEELTVEDVAIVSGLPPALVAAKVAVRVGEIVGPDGATDAAGYRRIALDELRGWLAAAIGGVAAASPASV